MSEAWAEELERVLVAAGRHVVRVIEGEARRPVDAFCIVADSGSCWFASDEAPVGWRPGDPLPPCDGTRPEDPERRPPTPGFVAHVVRFNGRWPEESVRRTVGEDPA